MKHSRMTRALVYLASGSLLLSVLGGCGSSGDSQTSGSGDPEADRRAELRVGSDDGSAKPRTLYERIGGREKIAQIVDDVTERAIADPRVNFSRANVERTFLGSKPPVWQATAENIDRLKQHLTEFLTLAAGGPADYSGRDMREVHKGMRITNTEFDAMVGDIKMSMERLGVKAREQREMLAVIETTRKQVVEKQ